jgi:hypothetical protein
MIPLASTDKPTAAAGDGFALSAEALLLPLDFDVKKERISGGIVVDAQTFRSWVSKGECSGRAPEDDALSRFGSRLGVLALVHDLIISESQ